MFASIRNPDALSHAVARPRTAIRLLFGEALGQGAPAPRYVRGPSRGVLGSCELRSVRAYPLPCASIIQRIFSSSRRCGRRSSSATARSTADLACGAGATNHSAAATVKNTRQGCGEASLAIVRSQHRRGAFLQQVAMPGRLRFAEPMIQLHAKVGPARRRRSCALQKADSHWRPLRYPCGHGRQTIL